MRPLKVHGFERFSVVYVSVSKYKIQDFSFIVNEINFCNFMFQLFDPFLTSNSRGIQLAKKSKRI